MVDVKRPQNILTDMIPDHVMSLHDLLGSVVSGDVVDNVVISGVSDDSRKISAGDAYLCMPRTSENQESFVVQAVQAGAVAVIFVGEAACKPDVASVVLSSLDELGQFLRRWFGTGKLDTRVIGITGTDGKTSNAWFIREALLGRYLDVWSIGTLGWISEAHGMVDLGNTTPSLLTMHQILAAAQAAGVQYLVCEVSSHGIAQQRIADIPFDAVLWTNLGHDHLEDHGGFEAYASTKAGFIQAAGEAGASVVGNADHPELVQRMPGGTFFYGQQESEHDVDLSWRLDVSGQLILSYKNDQAILSLPDANHILAENIAASTAVLLNAESMSLTEALDMMHPDSIAPGRMQKVRVGNKFACVDYAHTPEGLERCLREARYMADQVYLVFGCGGERDQSKRAVMGGIAARLADRVWLSNDNPRSESPKAIVDGILAGVNADEQGHFQIELDRRAAISQALAEMSEDGLLVIAGKGHETSMDIAGEKLPWSDVAVLDEISQSIEHKDDSYPGSGSEASCV